jgi:hypothetical protein
LLLRVFDHRDMVFFFFAMYIFIVFRHLGSGEVQLISW